MWSHLSDIRHAYLAPEPPLFHGEDAHELCRDNFQAVLAGARAQWRWRQRPRYKRKLAVAWAALAALSGIGRVMPTRSAPTL